MDTIGNPRLPPDNEGDAHAQESGLHVKFAGEEEVQAMPIDNINDEDNISSGASTPSEDVVGPSSVAKLLASRLSFWSRLSKRAPSLPSTPMAEEIEPMLAAQTVALNSIFQSGKEEPSRVLGSILAATAPPPVSSEERHSELEAKIVRECVREFTKGGMYFAYNFGMSLSRPSAFKSGCSFTIKSDITRSLQHKQEQSAKSEKQKALLADLNALDEYNQSSSQASNKANALTEPYSTLPLWRRVDRQFWWNEWLSKPFVDAGVSKFCRHAVHPLLTCFTYMLSLAAFVRAPYHARILPNIVLPCPA